ncbi:MAG: hypothetical protein J7501_03045, partial [Bdellovibrio sp.]|nr:hypothetical protein [Bdellovibrio sp.]
ADGALKVSLIDLFGASFIDSILLHDFSIYKLRYTEISYVQSANQVIAYNTALMAVAKPDSLFYPALLQYITKYGFIDLLPGSLNEGHLSYVGMSSMYPDFRDNLYVVIPQQMFGEHIYLNIYDKNDSQVGRVYLK